MKNIKVIHRFVVLASLTFFALPLRAEEPLSLQQAIEQAVRGNPDLRRQRILVETEDAQILQARGAFDFRLTADASRSRSTTPPLTSEDLQGGFTNTTTYDLGLVRALETGGNVSLGLRDSASKSNSRLPCGNVGGIQADCTVYSTSLNLNFTHPLLKGFGTEVAMANLRRQHIQRDQALLNREMSASNVLRDVINTYWGLSYATQNLAIQRAAVDLAKEQLRVTQAQIDVGRLAPVDAAAVQRAIVDRMQSVLVAEQDLLYRTLELRRLFGLAMTPTPPIFSAQDVPDAHPHDVDVSAEIQHALDANPQLKSVSLGITLSQVDLDVARSTLKPQLDFVGNIGSNGRRTSFNESVTQTLGFDAVNWSAGLNFSLPIENRTARGQVRAAEVEGESARLEAGDLDLEIRNQVLRLASQVRSASQRVQLAKQTVDYANQNLEAEKARFSVGRSTNNDVLLRQQELRTSQIQEVQATVDLLVGDTTLEALTGELLERYRIVLKGI